MPAPYSDNLYSAGDDSDDDRDALSPTDGYFHASTSDEASSSTPQRTSANVPFVPNVLVEDPSLSEGSKASEAEQERRLYSHTYSSPQPSVSQPTSPQQARQHQVLSPPSSSSPTHHHHQHRPSDEEEPVRHSPSGPAASSSPLTRNPLSLRDPLFLQHQVDAPPAYTPSPSAHPSGYQTFAPSSSTMGQPLVEQERLLSRDPESMGGPPGGPSPTRWQRAKAYWHILNFWQRLMTIAYVLAMTSIFVLLFRGLTPVSNHKVCHPYRYVLQVTDT